MAYGPSYRASADGARAASWHRRWPQASERDYPYNKGKHLIAIMLFAYGDDSGTHKGAKYCLVMGYIASPRQWKLLRRDWNDALLELPVPEGKKPEFHAKDFFDRRTWQSRKSPYHGWKEPQAKAFLDHLLDAIQSRQLTPIGGACDVEEFFKHSEDNRRWLTGATLFTFTHWHEGKLEIIDKMTEHESSPNRPYFAIFDGFLFEAVEASKAAGGAEVHVVLDRQADMEARAKAAFEAFKRDLGWPEANNLKSIRYADSEDEVGLQAADLYAYAWSRELNGTMTAELHRTLDVLTRRRRNIVVAGKRFFDGMLEQGDENRMAAIKRAREGLEAQPSDE